MKKERLLFALVVGVILLCSGVYATPTASVSSINSTFATVYLRNVQNLYGYEVSFDYSGGAGTTGVQQYSIFGTGSSATYGSNLKGSIFSVYGSKLNGNGTGISNNGDTPSFNVTHTNGDISPRYVLFVYNDTTEEYVFFNVTATVPGSTASSSSSSGGGGGGSSEPIATTSDEVKLKISDDSLNFNLIAGQEGKKEITLSNTGNVAIDVLINSVGLEGLIPSNFSIYLSPGEERTFEIPVSATTKGLLTGKLIFLFKGKQIAELPVVINVKSDNFLFDSSVTVSDEYRKIYSGQVLRAQVYLKEVISKEKVDVVVNYVIKDFSGKEYLQDSETFFVQDSKSFVKDFSTKDLPPGKYIVGIDITYPGAFATSSAQFEIASRLPDMQNVIVVVLIVAIVLIALAIIWFARRKTGFGRPHHYG